MHSMLSSQLHNTEPPPSNERSTSNTARQALVDPYPSPSSQPTRQPSSQHTSARSRSPASASCPLANSRPRWPPCTCSTPSSSSRGGGGHAMPTPACPRGSWQTRHAWASCRAYSKEQGKQQAVHQCSSTAVQLDIAIHTAGKAVQEYMWQQVMLGST